MESSQLIGGTVMNEAIEFLKQNLNKNETVVVAVSGGPDSMVLLHLVNNLKQEYSLKIVCAHVNHKLRDESEDEADMIRHYCTKNAISFEYMTIDNYKDDNFHNDARIKRYTFFEECVNKYQANHLLTAHHGDDLIETILMRLIRGSSLKGYAGFLETIPRETFIILRPLIQNTKTEIMEFAKENKIIYAVDQSNEKDIYTRNRIRKNILPSLKEEDANVHKKFYKFSKTLELYSNYIDKEVKTKLNSVYKNNELDIDKFKKLDDVIQIKIINFILEEAYQDDLILITDKHTDMILDLINSDKANQTVSLPNKIGLKSYNIFKIIEDLDNHDYKYELKKEVSLPNGKKIETIKEIPNNTNFTCTLNSKELKLPLYVRNRMDGDKMQIKGMEGTKKVKDIFIDEKVPLEERSLWPVLVDSKDNIVWLPGLKKSQFNKQKDENYDIILRYY